MTVQVSALSLPFSAQHQMASDGLTLKKKPSNAQIWGLSESSLMH